MDRIIVRTKWNVSYVGEVTKSLVFDAEGITLKVSPKAKTLCYIPKDEIKEIVAKTLIMTYDEYINLQ